MPSVIESTYDKQLISINEAARILGIGRTNIYNRINNQDLQAVRIGGRRLIKLASIEAFVDRLSGDQ